MKDGRLPKYTFLALSCITLPLYVIVLWTVVKQRLRKKDPMFKEPFYLLILSQGLVDMISMLAEVIGSSILAFEIGFDFIADYSFIIAPLSAGFTYYFVVVRTFGDLLFSLQRLLVFRFRDTYLTKISKISLSTVMAVHFIPPAIFSLPTWCFPQHKLIYVLNGQLHEASLRSGFEREFTLMLCFWVIAAFGITLVIDLYLVVMIATITKESANRASRELRYTLIVVAQAVALSGIFVYFSAKCVVMTYQPSGVWPRWLVEISLITDYWPLFNGLESLANPWIYVILNTQLRQEILRSMGVKKSPIAPIFVSSLS